MACPRVCVIDTSASVRETIGIVLAADCDVVCLPPENAARIDHECESADLVIVEAGQLAANVLAKILSSSSAVIWLEPRTGERVERGRGPALSRSFSPSELKSAVERALTDAKSRQSAPAPAILVDHPVLPLEAAALARHAARTTLPVLLCGEPGSGKTRLARAIHALSQSRRCVTLGPGRCQASFLADEAGTGILTIFVERLEDLSAEEQRFLLSLLENGSPLPELPPLRLICATCATYERLGSGSDFNRALFYRLSVLPITLPPLRHRAAELPAIITAVAGHLSRGLNVANATFTTQAMHRLSNYLWFGNLAELETVLTRSLTLTQHRPLDVSDLLFGYGPLVRVATATSSPTIAEPLPPSDTNAVDLVINELAHEFKNPMVTIKTISQHLDRLLADEEGRHHVAQITGEAVDRMDRVLENLLQFTRFGNPLATNVALNALLAPCLGELAPLLTERRVVLNYQPAEPIHIHVDAEQISYAAENLLRSVVRDLPEGETLSIRALPSPPAFSVEFSNQHQGVAARLTQFLDGPDELGDSALPLGLLFARTLIQRNGGTFDLKINQGQAVITVRLPGQEELAFADGKTTNPHC